MSARVGANAERVYINNETTETRKEFEDKAKQCVALRIESNRLEKSISERENRIEEAQNGISACKERINQSSGNITTLNARQQKIEEAKLKALQRKNS